MSENNGTLKATLSAGKQLNIALSNGSFNGTYDHSELYNRDAENQHPISAITDLQYILNNKQEKGNYLTEETDPTVPEWAKAKTKPTYTADEIGAVSNDKLQDAIDNALEQAKSSGEFDGHSPDITANKTEKTTTISVDGKAIAEINDGTVGKDGTSVTITSISESTEDGGENVVTFDDGKNLVIKNGNKGSAGTDGIDGYSPVKGKDYWTDADKTEIVEETKSSIDLSSYAKESDIPTKVSELENDSGYGTYSKPTDGIPKSDLSSDVQESLDKVSTIPDWNVNSADSPSYIKNRTHYDTTVVVRAIATNFASNTQKTKLKNLGIPMPSAGNFQVNRIGDLPQDLTLPLTEVYNGGGTWISLEENMGTKMTIGDKTTTTNENIYYYPMINETFATAVIIIIADCQIDDVSFTSGVYGTGNISGSGEGTVVQATFSAGVVKLPTKYIDGDTIKTIDKSTDLTTLATGVYRFSDDYPIIEFNWYNDITGDFSSDSCSVCGCLIIVRWTGSLQIVTINDDYYPNILYLYEYDADNKKWCGNYINDSRMANSTYLGGVAPVDKTDDMTQEIGIDTTTGRLWTIAGMPCYTSSNDNQRVLITLAKNVSYKPISVLGSFWTLDGVTSGTNYDVYSSSIAYGAVSFIMSNQGGSVYTFYLATGDGKQYKGIFQGTTLSSISEIKPNIDLSEYAKTADVPTKTSQLDNDSGYLTEHQSLADYAKTTDVESDIATVESNTDTKLAKYLPLAGGTATGAIVAPSLQTGTDESNYFQTKKMRGEGDATKYYHAVDWGYANHNQVDFHEYGGIWNFYKNTAGTSGGGILVGSVKATGWNGGAVLTGAPTAPTAATGTNTTQIATTAFVTNAVSGKEDTANKTTSLSADSTDTQYPSAKCVYDLVGDVKTLIDNL